MSGRDGDLVLDVHLSRRYVAFPSDVRTCLNATECRRVTHGTADEKAALGLDGQRAVRVDRFSRMTLPHQQTAADQRRRAKHEAHLVSPLNIYDGRFSWRSDKAGPS